MSRPSPRTSVTRGSAASPSRIFWPSTVTCSRSPSDSIVPMTASAAAHATGLPPNVVPWLPGSSRSPAAPTPMQAPIGKPPPRPLATVTTSGVIPADAVGEPPPGPAHAGLHLVEPEQRTVRVGDGAGGGEVALGRHDDAGLALHRLEQDRRGLVGDRGRERLGVAVRHEGHVAGQRQERRPVRLLGRQRERAHGPAVEAALGRDDVGAAGPPGELERRLVGLGAGVGDEHLRRAGVRAARRASRPARPGPGW